MGIKTLLSILHGYSSRFQNLNAKYFFFCWTHLAYPIYEKFLRTYTYCLKESTEGLVVRAGHVPAVTKENFDEITQIHGGLTLIPIGHKALIFYEIEQGNWNWQN